MREKFLRVFDRERLARFASPGRLRYVSLGVVGLLVVGAALLGVVSGGEPTPASSFAGDSSSRRIDDEAARGTDRTAPSATPSSPAPTPEKTPPKPKKPTEEPKQTEEQTDTTGSGSGPSVNVPASCDHLSGNRAIGCAVMVDEGFGMDQWSCLNSLWDHESGWNHKAENPSSGAYGIPQALPGSKMGSEGGDWATNPATQVKWGLGYIKGRYDSPCGAWGFWQANNWY
ncbi:lytic transglycosylase domain-containing protein [Phytomonospora sp. NPDC050363]|uniref:aggregation-promoting factor C-terminal-like domain-containing protein n=1 Tax=Phytomonospora sp. NPDC050363 TaxID=3155642 RepID=UPI0033D1FB68